jgi:hypothetical protein
MSHHAQTPEAILAPKEIGPHAGRNEESDQGNAARRRGNRSAKKLSGEIVET